MRRRNDVKPSKPADDGVTQRAVPTAEGQAASTGSEASAVYGEGSMGPS